MALESGEAALFPRSWEAEGAHAGTFSPHSCGDGGEGNRDACSLLESDVIWDLQKRLSAGILSSPFGHLYYEAYLGEIYRRSDSVLLERCAFLLEATRDYPVTTRLISTRQNHPDSTSTFENLHPVALGDICNLRADLFDDACAVQTTNKRIGLYHWRFDRRRLDLPVGRV